MRFKNSAAKPGCKNRAKRAIVALRISVAAAARLFYLLATQPPQTPYARWRRNARELTQSLLL
jgi:hypothetical protein